MGWTTLFWSITTGVFLSGLPCASPPGEERPPAEPPRWALQERRISQVGSSWWIAYGLRYEGTAPLDLTLEDLSLSYDAWVANSRCPPHTYPRESTAAFSPAAARSLPTSVIRHNAERLRCREILSVTMAPTADLLDLQARTVALAVTPRETVWVLVAIAHDHVLYGLYDPLLGDRRIALRLGDTEFTDVVPLTAELVPVPSLGKVLSTPPPERRDARHYRSPPDSLYLAADIPGHQYFRCDDLPVRYSTLLRVRFSYLVAVGTEGTCAARVLEYQDMPNAWYTLEGGFEEPLGTRGTWTHFARTFRTRSDTTTLALDFRIVGANVGECWLDDIALEPLNEGVAQRRGP